MYSLTITPMEVNMKLQRIGLWVIHGQLHLIATKIILKVLNCSSTHKTSATNDFDA
ncbi:hypothetical protein CR513_32311, partial [Mucuna pruriens]